MVYVIGLVFASPATLKRKSGGRTSCGEMLPVPRTPCVPALQSAVCVSKDHVDRNPRLKLQGALICPSY
ncbi:hypothetical protein DPEC_G00285410 [Dallia pectoralis]|uniref:Uncharacterized protein n=1 Tax=Dallia pectoralis TaxID=75939 RepID=A0ACC2FJS7_DALPE|nr:hypothetical protein DPEC_G00285410 [Dallia pectoralis]